MDFIQHNLMLVILTATSGAMLLFNLLQGGAGARVTTGEATNLINREDAQVLDVREAADFATGHLAGARNIPVAKFGERAADLDKLKGAPLIVCCVWIGVYPKPFFAMTAPASAKIVAAVEGARKAPAPAAAVAFPAPVVPAAVVPVSITGGN